MVGRFGSHDGEEVIFVGTRARGYGIIGFSNFFVNSGGHRRSLHLTSGQAYLLCFEIEM